MRHLVIGRDHVYFMLWLSAILQHAWSPNIARHEKANPKWPVHISGQRMEERVARGQRADNQNASCESRETHSHRSSGKEQLDLC